MKYLITTLLTVVAMTSTVQAKQIDTISWSELEKPPKEFAISTTEEQEEQTSIRTDLIGKEIRIPGYVVPLEGDNKTITEFLLVPYFGACTHVPPPPANQIVLVKFPKGVPVSKLFDAVWVEGKLTSESTENDIAPVGYSLTGYTVEVYQ
ncbi:MAG: DUF3299 domain-containing protein [Alteromonadales bacterium]|nr:DUF3299 domain-containing protein [Alteromonadales bacterium]